jgi:hypothetical protein
MFKYSIHLALLAAVSLELGCSDDDGANVPRKGPIVSAGSGGSAGDGGSGPATDAGEGGSSGSAGSGGGNGGSGGAPACVPPVAPPDAGLDAGSDASLDASADGGPAFRIVSFETDIQPIFAARCGPCHVTDSSAGQNVGSADIDEAYADAVDLGQVLVDRVNAGGMPPSYAPDPNSCGFEPPGSPGCIAVAELELLQTWLAQCTPP